MDPKQVKKLLEAVQTGGTSIDEAMKELADLPFRDLGFAQVDHHRHLRSGFPEVVLGLVDVTERPDAARTVRTLLAVLGPVFFTVTV